MDSAIDLRQRRVLVTGGSMGIGLEIARACLRCGASVMIAARGEAAVNASVTELKESSGDRIAGVCADVSTEAGVTNMLDAVEQRFGTLTSLVHAAAVLGPIGSILDVEPERWWANLRVNLFGTFLIARGAADRMRDAGGRMVLLSGGGASGPFPNYSPYAASKVAVVRFTETIALELAGFGIAVNSLAPGFVATRMHQETLDAGVAAGADYLARTRDELDRGGASPQSAARAAAFLLSNGAAGISGKFVSAQYDDYWGWPSHLDELNASDAFTLRRILPKDRGMSWQ